MDLVHCRTQLRGTLFSDHFSFSSKYVAGLAMAPESTPSKGTGTLSLYANLLDPSADKSATPGTISRPPVVFKQGSEAEAQSDEPATKKQQLSAGRLSTLLSELACSSSVLI